MYPIRISFLGALLIRRLLPLALLLFAAPSALAAHAIPGFAEVRAGARPSVAVLLSRDGTPLAERRLDMEVRRLEWISLDSLSPALKEALLAAEDKRFFEHSGVDWRAFAGSLWHNLWYDRKRGASTLSMQLAGLLDPDLALGVNGTPRRSLGQKWNQALAAQALEARWTKEQILEAYLNLAPFRGDLQGVHAASRALFGKGPGELGRPEALVLAVLLRGPNARPEVVARRACVLAERMNAPAACAPAQRLVTASLDRPSAAPRWDLAPHAARLLLRQAGERVVSTLDAEAQRVLLGALKRPGLSEAAAGVVVENASGDIVAYVGGVDGVHPDMLIPTRNLGNLLQPFAYGLALERRLITAASLIEEPLSNHAPTVPDDRTWVSVRQALAGGMADPAQSVGRMLGDSLAERLRQADVDLPRGSTPELGLVTLAGLYRSLPSGGQWLAPRLLPGVERQARRLLKPEAAFIVSEILVDSEREAGGLPSVYREYGSDGREVVGAGYSDRFTVVLWASGGRASAAVGQAWRDVLGALHRPQAAHRLVPPAGVVSALVVFEPPIETPRREWFIRGTEQERVGPPRSLPRIAYPANGSLVDAMALADDPSFRISLDAHHAPSGAWWRLNGERLVGSNGLRLAWRPVAGRHVLDLMSAEGQILDSAIFAVRAPLE